MVIYSSDLPEELEGFVDGNGVKSIACVRDCDLGFNYSLNLKGYISEPIHDIYYAGIFNDDILLELSCGKFKDMYAYVTDSVYELCNDLEMDDRYILRQKIRDNGETEYYLAKEMYADDIPPVFMLSSHLAISDALGSKWTKRVYKTKNGSEIRRELLNGSFQVLYRDDEKEESYFKVI